MKKISLLTIVLLLLMSFAVDANAKKKKAEKLTVLDSTFKISPAVKDQTTTLGDDEILMQIKGNSKFASAGVIVDLTVAETLAEVSKGDSFELKNTDDPDIEDFSDIALVTLLYVSSEEDGTTFQYSSDEETTIEGTLTVNSINLKNGKVQATLTGTMNNVLKSELDTDSEVISETRANDVNIQAIFSTVVNLDD